MSSTDLALPHAPAPRRLARIAARLRAGSLDRALIAGADAGSSAALAARAAVLTAPAARHGLADTLEALLAPPHTRRRPLHDRRVARANAARVRAAAAGLRDAAAPDARGVAILHELVADGSGPLYRSTGTAATARALDAALLALAVRR